MTLESQYSYTLINEQAVGINILVPDPEEVRLRYLADHEKGIQTEFPYWSRVWPSSLAMAIFLEQHPEYIGEQVLELGAGMGLPSFMAARYASSVRVSDYLDETVRLLQKNISRLELTNIVAEKLDWNSLPEDIFMDTLLLSDINYDPSDFKSLQDIIRKFVNAGVTIILSTPERIAGKSFINFLVPYIIHRETIVVAGTSVLIVIVRK